MTICPRQLVEINLRTMCLGQIDRDTLASHFETRAIILRARGQLQFFSFFKNAAQIFDSGIRYFCGDHQQRPII